MTEKIVVLRVFESDAAVLLRKYGKPQWAAFRLAIKACAHPEEGRVYVQAEVPGKDNDVLKEGENRFVYGFLCKACHRYIMQV